MPDVDLLNHAKKKKYDSIMEDLKHTPTLLSNDSGLSTQLFQLALSDLSKKKKADTRLITILFEFNANTTFIEELAEQQSQEEDMSFLLFKLKNEKDMTAIDYASKYCMSNSVRRMVQLLHYLPSTTVTVHQTKKGISRLFGKKDTNTTTISIFEIRDANGMTPLHHAVVNCDIVATRKLLIYGSPINICDEKHKQTPLEMATAASSSSPIMQEIAKFLESNIKRNSIQITELNKRSASFVSTSSPVIGVTDKTRSSINMDWEKIRAARGRRPSSHIAASSADCVEGDKTDDDCVTSQCETGEL